MRKVIIEEVGKPRETAEAEIPAKIDSDWLIVAGVIFSETGMAIIWWPAALLLAGIFCFVFYFLLHRFRKAAGKK